jgi:hypothetical protein
LDFGFKIWGLPGEKISKNKERSLTKSQMYRIMKTIAVYSHPEFHFMKANSFKKIITTCGREYMVSYLDQLLIGTFERENDTGDAPYIPSTYALYQTLSNVYILEVTIYEPEKNNLLTTYQLLPENEAARFILRNAPWKMGA